MTARSLHRIAGVVMLLPFLAWAVTGAIFFLKPGYGGAYDIPVIPTTAMTADRITIDPEPAWLEVRALRTVLGPHLLVRTEAGWQQLDPQTKAARGFPPEPEMRRLIESAFASDPSRYGHIVSMNGPVAMTDTGVHVTLNWARLALSQRGPDTDRIDRIYKIHYLQWTGVPTIDRILGGTGLALIVVLSALGARLLVKPSRPR